MNLLFCLKECFYRIWARKTLLIILFLLFLCSIMCGILFINTPAIYDYHINLCDRFIDRICYSSTSVIIIFFERTAGHALYLVLLFACGAHIFAWPFAPAVLIYRGYTFGGTLFIFFSVYRVSGALIALVLYLPVHLMFDILFLCVSVLSFERARNCSFCGDEWKNTFNEFLLALIIAAAICILEALLLAVLFHPMGNII